MQTLLRLLRYTCFLLPSLCDAQKNVITAKVMHGYMQQLDYSTKTIS